MRSPGGADRFDPFVDSDRHRSVLGMEDNSYTIVADEIQKEKRHHRVVRGAVLAVLDQGLAAEANTAHSTHHGFRVDLLETRRYFEE